MPFEAVLLLIFIVPLIFIGVVLIVLDIRTTFKSTKREENKNDRH